MRMRLLDFLVGRELANSEAEQDKMTTLEGLPAIGLDGLASSAYGPEAALAILAPLGALGANWLAPITLAISEGGIPIDVNMLKAIIAPASTWPMRFTTHPMSCK